MTLQYMSVLVGVYLYGDNGATIWTRYTSLTYVHEILTLCPILTISGVLEPCTLYRLTEHTYAKFRTTLAQQKTTISLSRNGQFCLCKWIFTSFIYDSIVKLVFLKTRFLTNKLYNKAGKCILHNYQLINSMQSFYRSSANHKIPHLLWNPEVRYRVRSSPPLVPVLSQLNSVIMQTTVYCGLILLNIRTAEQCSVIALGKLLRP